MFNLGNSVSKRLSKGFILFALIMYNLVCTDYTEDHQSSVLNSREESVMLWVSTLQSSDQDDSIVLHRSHHLDHCRASYWHFKGSVTESWWSMFYSARSWTMQNWMNELPAAHHSSASISKYLINACWEGRLIGELVPCICKLKTSASCRDK
jgi:hypothetical protein